MTARIATNYRVGLVAWAALVALQLAWHGWLFPPQSLSTALVLGTPLRSLTWLANWLAQRGTGLKRGQFVASGSCTGMNELAPMAVATASFGGLAEVTVKFVPKAAVEKDR